MIDQVQVLNELRARVNELLKMKQELLDKGRDVPILAAHELEDTKKMTDTYKAAIERNSAVIDLIVDIKNTILILRLTREKLDPTVGGMDLYNQCKNQLDGFIKTLKEMVEMLKEEKDKMDRVVRFYERNYNSYV